MTHNDYTKLMLNIKDDNIYFYDDLLTIENIKGIEVGDWILLEHGHWSTSMLMEINGEPIKLWYISPKSYKTGVMAVSKTMPEQLKEFGITDDTTL